MTKLVEIARTTVSRRGLLPDGSPVLAMVSGGADSTALLHLLAKGVFGEHPLRVLHVNHLLREDAASDEAFVVAMCACWGIDARVARYDVGAYADAEGLNLEDAGRRVRYRLAEQELDALCEELGLPAPSGRIAVAHTLDDRIETFFMRAISGAGTRALAGIPAQRGRIVRPLIDCERSAVREYLESLGVEWCEDATNTDTDRSRALVRAQILPAAERLNPSYRDAMRRTMDLLADDEALLDRLAGGFARDFAEVADGEVRFHREWMRSLERTMARRTVRDALSRAFPESGRLEAEHIEALVDGLDDEGFARDLPYGMRAFSEYGTLVVSQRGDAEQRVAPGLLTVPGHVDLGAAGSITAIETRPTDIAGQPDSVVIDADAVERELTVGSWREGERMRPLGMTGSRKLSDMLAEAKVSRRLRGLVPVVRDGERVVWVAGVRMSDEYRVTERTARAVRLTWERGAALRGWFGRERGE